LATAHKANHPRRRRLRPMRVRADRSRYGARKIARNCQLVSNATRLNLDGPRHPRRGPPRARPEAWSCPRSAASARPSRCRFLARLCCSARWLHPYLFNSPSRKKSSSGRTVHDGHLTELSDFETHLSSSRAPAFLSNLKIMGCKSAGQSRWRNLWQGHRRHRGSPGCVRVRFTSSTPELKAWVTAWSSA
jgi:hypothetical protein